MFAFAFLFSCKTNQKLVDKTVTVTDSTAVFSLNKLLSEREQQITTLSTQVATLKSQNSKLSEQLLISKKEIQSLRENIEAYNRKYDPQTGNLIEESGFKKTSEEQKESTSILEKYKELQSQFDFSEIQYSVLKSNYDRVIDESTKQESKINLLEKEKKNFETQLESNSKSIFWMFIIGLVAGFALGLFVYYYLNKLFTGKKVFKK